MENLSIIYTIFKNLFLLSDKELIEQLLRNDLHLITFGALDYAFETQTVNTIRHRDHFESKAKLKNILNISNETMLNTFHLNYRLTYLRDTAISDFITDNLRTVCTIIIASNNCNIVNFFLSNKNYISQLICQFKIKNTYSMWDINIIKYASKFIIELIHCSKDSIDQNKINEALCEYGLLTQIEHYLNHPIKSEIGTLLSQIVFEIHNENSHLIQNQIMNHLSNSFLFILSEFIFAQDNLDLKYELSAMIQSLFSISNSNQFIGKILNNCFNNIIDLLINQNTSSESKEIILLAISNCMSSIMHYNQLHLWTKETNIIVKILSLKNGIKTKKKLQLNLIKFIKVIFDRNYEIDINEEVFDWIFELFLRNNKNDNLISSTIISLFSFIATRRIHLVNSVFEINAEFFYRNKPYFAELIDKYESMNTKNDKLINADLNENNIKSEDDSIDNDLPIIPFNNIFEFDGIDSLKYDDHDNIRLLGKKICPMNSLDDIFNDEINNSKDDFMD